MQLESLDKPQYADVLQRKYEQRNLMKVAQKTFQSLGHLESNVFIEKIAK